MLTPDYLDSLPEPVVSLFREAENEILLDMARSLSQLENPEALANWQKWKMEQLAQIRSKSAAELTRTAGLSQKKLQSLFQQAATQSLQADDKIYRAAGLSPGSPNDSPELLQLLNSGAQQTSQHFTNTYFKIHPILLLSSFPVSWTMPGCKFPPALPRRRPPFAGQLNSFPEGVCNRSQLQTDKAHWKAPSVGRCSPEWEKPLGSWAWLMHRKWAAI